VGVDAGVAVFNLVGVKLGSGVSVAGSSVFEGIGVGTACGVAQLTRKKRKRNKDEYLIRGA
jgi:phytoene dehydrogenase-like protein